jgi:hypothetical protein
MVTEELSKKEEIHLYNLSVIPCAIVFILIMVYFVYLMHTNPIKSVADYLFRVGSLIAIFLPLSIFGTFELLYSRKVKKPFKIHLKRFIGKMVVALTMMSSLFGILSIFFYGIPTFVSEAVALICSFTIWSLIWAITILRFRRVFDKLYQGQW